MLDIQKDKLEELIKKQFGIIVKEQREKLGLNQEEFAFRCDLHKDTISRIENFKTLSNLLTIFQIAKGLEKNPISLFISLVIKIYLTKNK